MVRLLPKHPKQSQSPQILVADGWNDKSQTFRFLTLRDALTHSYGWTVTGNRMQDNSPRWIERRARV